MLLHYSALFLGVKRNVGVTGICMVHTLYDLCESW
jgi:hypothetical protein